MEFCLYPSIQVVTHEQGSVNDYEPLTSWDDRWDDPSVGDVRKGQDQAQSFPVRCAVQRNQWLVVAVSDEGTFKSTSESSSLPGSCPPLMHTAGIFVAELTRDTPVLQS